MPTNPAITRRLFMQQSSLAGLSLAALSSIPATALARSLSAPEKAPDEEPPMGVLGWTLLLPGIFALDKPGMGGNTLLIVAEGKALLIDTKFSYLGAALLHDVANQIQADITKDRIDLTLINTHHHGDHTGGNAIVLPIAGASYAHANALPRIRAQHESYVQTAKNGPAQLARSNASEQIQSFARAAADACEIWTDKTAVPKIAINGSGHTLSVGKIVVRTHHFGAGHTDNDLVIHLPEENIVHTGDLVFNGRHPYFDPSANATARGWINSLRETRKLCNSETTVIPGHGKIAGPACIDAQINYFEQLIQSVEAEINKGTAREAVGTMSWEFMKDLEAEQIRERAVIGVYDELINEKPTEQP